MKLISRLLLGLGLGVAALYGLAQVVDGDFARQFGMQILGVFGVIGLFFGIRASALASKEKGQLTAALAEQTNSNAQRSAWSGELKKRAMDVCALCARNRQECESIQMIRPEYCGDHWLEQIGEDMMASTELQAKLRAAADKLEQEGNAL